jgi:hypothetical protein
MSRYFHFGILALVVSSLMSNSALSAEVTMRMRDSTQTFSGKFVSFDGNVYVLETPLFGEMNFDASRFECISVDCENITKEIATGNAPPGDPAPSGLTQDREIELFEGFRNWNNFQTFLEWRKNNPN